MIDHFISTVVVVLIIMVTPFNRIAVYCGSSSGKDPVYADAARSLAEEMARRNIKLVYGGAWFGLSIRN